MSPKKKKTNRFFELIKTSASFVFRFLLRITPVTLLFVVVAFGISFLSKTLHADPKLTVSALRLRSNFDYPKEKVIEVLGLDKGINILTADLNQMESKLEKESKVKNAKLRRVLPNILDVELYLRQPVAYLEFTGSTRKYLLDEEGFVLDKKHVSEAPGELVLIEFYTKNKKVLRIGSRFYTTGIQNAYRLIQYLEMEQLFMKSDIERVSIDHLENVSLHLSNGLVFRLGLKSIIENASKIPKAIEILRKEKKDFSMIKYVDLRYDDMIVKE